MTRRPPREHTATPAELAREDELHRRAAARPVARVALRSVPLTDRIEAARTVLALAHAQLADLALCLATGQRSRGKAEAEKLSTTLGLASVAAADLLPTVRQLAKGAR